MGTVDILVDLHLKVPRYHLPEENKVDFIMVCSTKTKIGICGLSFGVILVVVIVCLVDSYHTIQQGNVGIYFVKGRLDDTYSTPGVHWAMPFVTEIKEITIRPQTDTLPTIKAVTRDGIENSFEKIQVLSNVEIGSLIPLVKKFGLGFREVLIFDRIAEELRIFCANHTIDEVYNSMFLDMVGHIKDNVEDSISRLGEKGIIGVKILNLVIPKPDIPPDIAANYKAVKVQWTEQLVATQQQKTEKIKKETESIKAVADAERHKKVLEIDVQKEILRKEGEKTLSTLENDILKEREQNQADVDKYKKTQDAEANSALYTPDFIKLEMAKALSQNTKFFFSGESIPLGAILSKIMGQV